MSLNKRINDLLNANTQYVFINRELKQTLLECREQFAHYAVLHRDKKTEDGDRKAAVNEDFVKRIDAVLDRNKPS